MGKSAGWQRYYHIASESAWGELDGSPSYIYVPVTSCDVRAKPQAVRASVYTGHRQSRYNRIVNHTVDGTLVTNALAYHVSSKSIAERLLTYAHSAPAGVDLDSFTLERFDAGNDNKRWLGCRIDSLTISGTAGQEITLSAAIKAKQESGGITAQSLSATAPRPVGMLFRDATLSIGGTPVEMRAFTYTVMNNTQVYHHNAQWPSQISAGERQIDFSVTLLKTANTYDALRRATSVSSTTGQLILRGLHNGTGASGTKTVITFDFDVLDFNDADDALDGPNGLEYQAIRYLALKPNTTDNDVDITYGLE